MALVRYIVRLAVSSVSLRQTWAQSMASDLLEKSFDSTLKTDLADTFDDIYYQQSNLDVILPSNIGEAEAIAHSIAFKLAQAMHRNATGNEAIKRLTTRFENMSPTMINPFKESITAGIATAISVALDPSLSEAVESFDETPSPRSIPLGLRSFANFGKPSVLVTHSFTEIKRAVQSALKKLDEKKLHAIKVATEKTGLSEAISLAVEISQKLQVAKKPDEPSQPVVGQRSTIRQAFAARNEAQRANQAVIDARKAFAQGTGSEQAVREAETIAATANEAAASARRAALSLVGKGLATLGLGAGVVIAGSSFAPGFVSSSTSAAKAVAVAGSAHVSGVYGYVSNQLAKFSLFDYLGTVAKIGTGLGALFSNVTPMKRLAPRQAGELAGQFYTVLATSFMNSSDTDVFASKIASIVAAAVVAALTSAQAKGLDGIVY